MKPVSCIVFLWVFLGGGIDKHSKIAIWDHYVFDRKVGNSSEILLKVALNTEILSHPLLIQITTSQKHFLIHLWTYLAIGHWILGLYQFAVFSLIGKQTTIANEWQFCLAKVCESFLKMLIVLVEPTTDIHNLRFFLASCLNSTFLLEPITKIYIFFICLISSCLNSTFLLEHTFCLFVWPAVV